MTEEKLSKIKVALMGFGKFNDSYDPDQEFDHIKCTRLTKQSLLAEISIMLSWQKKSITKTNGLNQLISDIITYDIPLSDIDKRIKEIKL